MNEPVEFLQKCVSLSWMDTPPDGLKFGCNAIFSGPAGKRNFKLVLEWAGKPNTAKIKRAFPKLTKEFMQSHGVMVIVNSSNEIIASGRII